MTDIEIASISLKDYKKNIDELRASLLSLESTSDEYKAIAQEVADRQSKLNEVMSVGKKDVDAVAGSYNALSQEMSNLKKEWKNMEIGTQAWEDMAKKINDINNQLKDADAKVGVFSRNVGDYANAFSTAFDRALGGLQKVDGPLGALAGTTKNMIPIIKQVNSVAVKGLNGIKKALASTGIGLLIIALSALIANWSKVMKFITGSKDRAKEAEEANEALNKTFEKQNFELEQEVKLMQAQGVSTEEIIKKKQDLIKQQIAEKNAQLENNRATLDAISKHSLLGRVLRGEQKEYKRLTELVKEQEEEVGKLIQKETSLDTDLKVDYENRKKKAKEAWEAEEKTIKERDKKIKESYKTEIQKLKEKYDEELKLLKKHHKSTTALTAQYNKDIAVLNAKQEKANLDTRKEERSLETMGVEMMDSNYWKKQVDNAKKYREELEKYVNENFKKIYDANKEVVKRELTEAEVNEIYEMLGVGSKIGFQKALREADIEIRTAIYELRDSLQSEELDAVRRTSLIPGTDSEIKNRIEVAEKELEQIKRTGKLASETDNEFKARVTEQIETIVELKKELASFMSEETEFEIQWRKLRDGYNSKYPGDYGRVLLASEQLRNYEDVMQTYIDNMYVYSEDGTEMFKRMFEGIDKETEEGYEKWRKTVLKNLIFFPEDARSQYLELLQKVRDEENAILEERVKNWFDMAGQVANIFGSIGSIYDEHIAHQKELLIEQGKTDEEANSMLENKFNVMKGFQIAEATINTISGALGAFMGITKDTGGWGIAAAAAQAAAVTIAGIAQIQKIANTTIGKTQTLSAPQVSVTPVLEDYQPQRFQNITTAEDERRLQDMMEKTNIVVNVSDIDRAQKKVRVRDGEASW